MTSTFEDLLLVEQEQLDGKNSGIGNRNLTELLIWTLCELYPVRKRLNLACSVIYPIIDLLEEIKMLLADLLELESLRMRKEKRKNNESEEEKED